MTSEAMRNGNKHFENLLFSKKAPRAKGQVSGHPGHPLDPPLFKVANKQQILMYKTAV